MSPAVTAFTRTFGAKSTARVWVRLSRPALAAPYAALPGFGRVPDTEAMFTIAPPESWSFITAYTAWEKTSGAIRLRSMIDREKRGDAVALSAGGEPPALFTRTSTRPRRATT